MTVHLDSLPEHCVLHDKDSPDVWMLFFPSALNFVNFLLLCYLFLMYYSLAQLSKKFGKEAERFIEIAAERGIGPDARKAVRDWAKSQGAEYQKLTQHLDDV
ncbi:unnamed protein product [Bursaphelenchus xylophilus]|uniref:(pine wood nematode) hypothetical protein n=1 Tax=Bursaphelenchus xylophilus TaxID=6326 RepID=A0A1I7RXJ7_BURXY|nr:unnamed protein product [Bursaphelenchus xylophilus]CAG9126492.1 unnamed protein product [Bursaphelenchus xylophilus]